MRTSKPLKEPTAYIPETKEAPAILTRPVRITLESRMPGKKEIKKTVTECERAVILSEKVTGAVRSKEDPSEFMEKSSGAFEAAGFQHPGDAVNLLVSSTVAAVHQMSGDDKKRFETNFLTAAQIMLDRSGISRDDLTLRVSDDMLKRRQEVIEQDTQVRAAAEGMR